MSMQKFALALVAALSGTAFAQEATLSVEKQTAMPPLSPVPYARIEFRQSGARETKVGAPVEMQQERTSLHVRPTLGLTLFKDRLDTSFTYDAQLPTSTNTVIKYAFFNETVWTVFKKDLGKDSVLVVGPDVVTDLTNPGSSGFSTVDAQLLVDATYQFNVPTGALALHGTLQPGLEYTTPQTNRQNPVPMRNETGSSAKDSGLALSGDVKDLQTAQKDPLRLMTYAGDATYKPSAVKGLGFGYGVTVVENWIPQYATDAGVAADGQPNARLAGYDPVAVTAHRLFASYQINEAWSLGGFIRHWTGGLNEYGLNGDHKDPTVAGIGANTWDTRVSLTANLF